MTDFEGRGYYPLDLADLPSGWASAFVGELCSEVQSGFASGEHNAQGHGVPHIRPMNIDRDGRLVMDETKYVNGDVDERRLRKGDVLFNNTNSQVLVGKTTAISNDAVLAFSNHMTRLRPVPEVDYRFLAHELHFLWMSGYFARRCSNHVNQASVSADALSTSVRVSFAPGGEQRRIVDAIDSYLSRLDAAVANLESAQAKLKAYRASVLKSAVEGRLVPTEAALARAEKRDFEPADVLLKRILAERRRRWEEAELAKMKAAGKSPKDDKWKTKYEEPEPPDTKNLRELPEGWCWARLGALMSIRPGFAFKSDDYLPDGEAGVPLVRQSELRESRVSLAKAKRLPERFLADHKAKFGITKGDILVGLSGSLTSVSTYVEDQPALQNQRTGLLQPSLHVSARFILQTYLSVADRIEHAGKGVAVQNVAPSEIESFVVRLPPLAEQQRMSEEVDRALSIVEGATTTIAADWRRCERLRQAILKWAFEGKLVDQDPNDEPAEKLLERIRAERAEAETSKRTRRARNGP